MTYGKKEARLGAAHKNRMDEMKFTRDYLSTYVTPPSIPVAAVTPADYDRLLHDLTLAQMLATQMELRASVLSEAAAEFAAPLRQLYVMLRCIVVEEDEMRRGILLGDLLANVKSQIAKIDYTREEIARQIIDGQL